MAKSFLELPETIRHRIYHNAGLVRAETIYVGHEERANIRRVREPGYSLPDLPFFLALSLTSRVVHTEIAQLFFSTNYFYAINAESLHRLPSSSLSQLTFLNLYVCLSGTPHRLHSKHNCGYKLHAHTESAALDRSILEHEALLMKWATSLTYVGRYIKPRNLQLRFVCDVVNGDTALLVLELLRCFSLLASCDVRLAQRPDRQLSNMARLAAEHAMGRPLSRNWISRGFDFFRLLPELRYRILEYTDLVTPLNCVDYRGGRFTLPRTGGHGYCCQPPFDACHRYAHQNCNLSNLNACQVCPHTRVISGERFNRCFKCPHYACQFYKCRARAFKEGDAMTACFCSCYHSSFSSECNCWRPPTAIFLTNRALHDEAKAVFLSRNHINVCDRYRLSEDVRGPMKFFRQPGLYNFISNIRSIHIQFHYAIMPVVNPDVEEWARIVERIVGVLNPHSLLFSVHLNNLPSIKDSGSRSTFDSPDIIDIARETANCYWPIQCLGRKDGIRTFVVGIDTLNYRLVYYCRHKAECIPNINMHNDFLNPIGLFPRDLHISRVFRRDSTMQQQEDLTGKHDSADDYIEGIFADLDSN